MTPDPDKAGVIGTVYHLNNGTYAYRTSTKKQTLLRLKKQQEAQKAKLNTLNRELLIQQQEVLLSKKSLEWVKLKQQQQYTQLKDENTRYSLNKKQHDSLKSQVARLDNALKKEEKRLLSQEQQLRLLEKKRNILRKEIIMQSSL